MTKDEALAMDLALEALEEYCEHGAILRPLEVRDAIKQARALDKMAENARELGLDYEPAGGTQVSKVWWDGEKLMAKPIPLEDIYQPAPVQEPVAQDVQEKCRIEAVPAKGGLLPAVPVQEPVATLWQHGETGRTRITMPGDITDCDARWFKAADLYTTPPAAQRQWVGLTDEERQECTQSPFTAENYRAIEAKLKEKNT